MAFLQIKSRIYRILKIIILLEGNHKKWRAKDIADVMGISVRTFYRDKKIIERLNIPIYFDKELNTYDILDTFKFKPPKLSKGEAISLLLAGKAFDKRNFPYMGELETALAKIINSFPESIKNVIQKYEDTIIFESSPEVDLYDYKEIIRKISTTINECRTIKIVYYSLSSNKTSKRKIDPYNIFYKNGAAYLVGNCHSRKSIRLFRIDRIKEFEVTHEHFSIPENYSLSDYTGNVWGVERGEDFSVKIKFSGFAAHYVQEYKWHDTQMIQEIDEDTIIYSVTTGSREEIKSWILGFGSDAEVLEPDDLREEVKEEIGEILKKY